MMVAHRATYGRSTWGPSRIGQGATRGPFGDTRGTHVGPTMDPSGPHMCSPYGSHVCPMRVAHRATYGWPTWGPRRIGQWPQWAHSGDTLVAPILAPPWPHLGPSWTVHTGHRRAPCGWPVGALMGGHVGPKQNLSGVLKGPIRVMHMGTTWAPQWTHLGPTWEVNPDRSPDGEVTHFGIQIPDALYASCCQPMLVPVTTEDGCS